ncbi:MAG: hypothetical protein RLZZ628_4188 [Bacteroidota bacterium]|jgi:hypothetical protein
MKSYFLLLNGLFLSLTAFAQTSETFESKRWYKELSPKINPSYYAVAKQQAPAMVLGLRNDVPNPTLIAFLRHPELGWVVLDLGNDHQGFNWVYGAAEPESGNILLFLQNLTNGPQPKFITFVSEDKGLTFQRGGDLRLPTGNAEVRVLSLDKKGKGFVTIRVDEDTTSGSKKIGYSTFVTKDGGKTWTVPEVNPNMLTETIQDSTTGFEGIMKIIERN